MFMGGMTSENRPGNAVFVLCFPLGAQEKKCRS